MPRPQRFLTTHVLTVTLAVFGCTSGIADPTGNGDVPVDECTSLHHKAQCRPAPMSPEYNQLQAATGGQTLKFKRSLELPEQTAYDENCSAQFAISFSQMNDQVRVRSEVTNETCEASHGEFKLRVRYTDAQGEIQTTDHTEQWSRTDDAVVKQTHMYPIGEGSYKTRVGIRSQQKTACLCD